MEYQQKLAKLWQEVSQKRIFKLKNIWKDLRLLSRYNLKFLRPSEIKLHFAAELLPDCANCPENCCHGAENTVSLRLVDIARLLDAGLAEAIDPDNKSFRGDDYFKQNPRAKRDIDTDDWNFFPVLKRVNNICPYLDKNNKCSIYKYRPITCRRFPYILSKTKKDIVFSQKCWKIKLESNPQKQAELFQATLDSYNEKIKDLILINYAQADLTELGFSDFLHI